MFECLFNKVAGLMSQHRCLPMNTVKFLRTVFFKNNLTPLVAASTEAYLGSYQTSMIQIFAKIVEQVKAINYLRQKLHHRYFWDRKYASAWPFPY